MSLFDLSDVQQIDIPEPIAPVRPVSSPVGQTIPFTSSTGITGNLDAAGNLWNAAGQYIGKMGPGTTGPQFAVPTAAASSTTQAPASSPGLIKSAVNSIAALASLEQWASNLVTRSTAPNTGITLEDIVFVIVGLILIGAAVFSFKGTQTIIQTVSKTAAKAAEVTA